MSEKQQAYRPRKATKPSDADLAKAQRAFDAWAQGLIEGVMVIRDKAGKACVKRLPRVMED